MCISVSVSVNAPIAASTLTLCVNTALHVQEKVTGYFFYRPQTNVFTSMCQEFCSQGGGVHPLGRPPWADTPLGRYPHPEKTPPWTDTLLPIRRPLQRTVHILLECTLVLKYTQCQCINNQGQVLRSTSHLGPCVPGSSESLPCVDI